MKLIDGKQIAKTIEEEIRTSNKTGGLAAILVGDNPESRLYVELKEKATLRVELYFEKHNFSNKTTQEKIINKIKELNNNDKITGILIQLPLPKHLNTNKIIQAIDPKKDADGFHPKTKKISPVLCATIHAIEAINTKIQEKNILMISKSEVFPLPFAKYFKNKSKNFKNCHPKDIKQYSKTADIIITALGSPHYLKASMVKDGAIIIDVGVHKQGKKVYGDADPKSLADKDGWLTPVPGGIGPITVACLLENIIK